MRGMSDLTREAIDDEFRNKIQRTLWIDVVSGRWTPATPRWTHDDNMDAQPLGWMILQLPSGRLDLISLNPAAKPKEIFEAITQLSLINPLCAKAISVLAADKFKYPESKYSFEKD